MAKTKGELRCCLFCGRDTRHRSGICNRCVRHGSFGKRKTELLDRTPLAFDGPCLEDRYDDESGPDDICDDGCAVDAERQVL